MPRSLILVALSAALCGGMDVALAAAAPTFRDGACAAGVPSTARCGTVRVLENRSNPGGRTLDLAVTILAASDASATAAAPVFFLAGGPGQAASALMPIAQGPFAEAGSGRDFVFVDQRGTGRSGAMLCANGSPEHPQRAFGQLFDPEQMRQCAEELGRSHDVRFYNSIPVVEDLDEVRRALGYGKVILWGGSGGTRTAQIWLRRHPEAIGAMLLDGVTPNDFRAPSGYAYGVQRAFRRMVEDCRAQPTCRAAYPDLPADLREILRLFEAGPVRTAIKRPDGQAVEVDMYRDDFAYALRATVYNARSLATLPGQLHAAAATGDLSGFAQALWQRDAALRSQISMGVHLAVFCSEDVPFWEPARLDELTEGTVLGRYLLEQYGGACAVWPSEPVDPSFLEPVRADVPTLLISGYYDPSTPPEGAARVAAALANSRHIVVRNQSHGAEFGCAVEAAQYFMEEATLEGLPEVCEGVGPVVFTTD